MRLRLETDYGIRCVLFLAQHTEYVQAGKIAAATQVPENVGPRVLSRLKKAGIVTARSGVMGGHKLRKKADRITLYDIVDCMEDCIMLSCEEEIDNPEIPMELVQSCLENIEDNMKDNMRKITVQQLLDGTVE